MGERSGVVSGESDSGSVTVLALAVIAAVMTTATAVVVAGSLALELRRAAMIADLAALAAARQGSCLIAAQVAQTYQARVSRCEASLTDVLVEIAAPVSGIISRATPVHGVRAVARAGF